MKRYFLLWLMLLGLYAARGQQGALDPSFSGDGWAKMYYLTEENTYDDWVEHMLLLPGGKYIAVISGSTQVMARYNADGTLDQSYGSGGYAYALTTSKRSSRPQF